MAQITILGAGAWGTALAQVLSHNHKVTIWGRDEAKINHYKNTQSCDTLKGVSLSKTLNWTSNLEQALKSVEVLILAIPTQQIRTALLPIIHLINSNIHIIQTAKGIEISSGLLVHQITAQIFPQNPLYLLSGPGFAIDVANLKPTALSLAWQEHSHSDSDKIQNLFFQTPIRPYRHDDIMGVALGGALKNILAIAAGFCMGYALGEGAKAAIITRGFNEMVLFAQKLQAKPQTLYGLSGLGDLMLTANSNISRNYQYGFALGQDTPNQNLNQTTEGYYTLLALEKMNQMSRQSYPIFTALGELVNKQKTKTQIIADLLERPLRQEFL